MTIEVRMSGAATPVERRVFDALFHNSVVNGYVPVARALEVGHIDYTKLVSLARKAEIPYPLFFAPYELVEAEVASKTEKLMRGLTKSQFSMNSRSTVRVADVELIVKDLLRKQELLKKHDKSLTKNPVAGKFGRKGKTPAADARRLAELLGFDAAALVGFKKKEKAFEYAVGRLEARQILVGQSTQRFMPQERPRATLSGITIKDAKVPYIFIASGVEEDGGEPAGRRLFTLTLLALLVSRGVFAPVTYATATEAVRPGWEFEVVSEFLIPTGAVSEIALATLDDVKDAAARFHVTPSAVTVRARRLGLITPDDAAAFLDALRYEYAQPRAKTTRSPLRAVNGVKRYNGVECSRRMLGLLDAHHLSPSEFCRVVALNRFRPDSISAFRKAVA